MAPGIVALIPTIAPYVLEGVSLAQKFIETISRDDATEADLDVLVQEFEASKTRRDAALDRLKAAIDAARASS